MWLLRTWFCLVLSVNIFHIETLGATEECGNHGVYRTCGPKCPRTCTNLDHAYSPLECDSGCVSGCFCEDGYVLHEKIGECVREDECPSCPKNETYQSSGYNCQTCRNHKSVFCATLKEFRCYCYPGYVRQDESLLCISANDCPRDYCEGHDEESDPCHFHSCQRTCQNRGYPVTCTDDCFDPKCSCPEGFLREFYTKKCVLEEDCP